MRGHTGEVHLEYVKKCAETYSQAAYFFFCGNAAQPLAAVMLLFELPYHRKAIYYSGYISLQSSLSIIH